MKGFSPVVISKHLGMHVRLITVAKIFGELHFRMALVIRMGKSTHESNDD
jgi:hypothetical protein